MGKGTILKGIAAAVVLTAAFTGSAMAGTAYTDYNTTVGRFNGNGYSKSQTKAIGGANGYILSGVVGANYTVDVRMNCNKGNASWLRDLDDNQSKWLPGYYKQTAGESIKLQFSNDLLTPVAVQVDGRWKSN